MKTKPKRHKSQNTFKFQTFSERISNIDIDIFHKVKHPYENDDDDNQETTYFFRILNKLKNDNFSPDFIALSKKLPNDVFSLPQLIVQKNNIMDILVNHIRVCDMESLPCALELMVAVANDLRKEFYNFFNPTILRECIRLLDTRDPDQIECVFTCLAHLFKFLWSPVVKNINKVLPELLPLLSSTQPNYIVNFAAESFAFVARKVRDKCQFLKLSLQNVKNNQNDISGVAKLFFEVMKNVANQFHSGAEEFLIILLEELVDRKWSSLLYDICENVISHIIDFVSTKTDVSPIWKAFSKVGNKFHAAWKENQDEYWAENLTKLLKLVDRLITCREIILRNCNEVVELTLTLIMNEKIKEVQHLQYIVTDVITHLLISPHCSSKMENIDNIIMQVMKNIEDEQLAVRFTEKLVQSKQYEFLCFKEFFKFIEAKGLDEFLVQFLAKIVWIKTRFNVQEENQLFFYKTCLRDVPDSFTDYLLHLIPDASDSFVLTTSETILSSIVVLSYAERCSTSFVIKVDKFIMILCNMVGEVEAEEDVSKLLFLLVVVFQYRLKSSRNIAFNCSDVIKLVMKFVNSCNYLCSLRLLDVILPLCDFECLNSTEDGILKLMNNLYSPFHKVRLFTLQVLTKLNMHPIFEHILKIETILPAIETYREKLQLLQKLECNETFLLNVPEEMTEAGVIKFLFANLYINFQLLWEPTQNIILSHLNNGTNGWPVVEHLLNVAGEDDINSLKIMENFDVDFKNEFVREYFYALNGVDDKPDFYNFRCLSLDLLTKVKHFGFTDKGFIPNLFLKFYCSEYTSGNFECKNLTNLMKFNNETEEKEIIDDFNVSYASDIKKRKKNLNRLLIIYLKLINNTMSQIPEKLRSVIFEKYFDLLCNGNSEVQQLALTYICKVLRLNTHRERLVLLTKENTFKEQLLNIKLDLNSEIFPEQDKPQFMKIVLKLLYGKIKRKGSPQLRDSTFEFLAGCKDSEIISFFDLFFNCVQLKNSVKNTNPPASFFGEAIDFQNTISPSCLASYTNTVLELLKRCGKLLKHACLMYLLRITFKIMSNIVIILNKRSEVHPGYYNLLGKIRVTSFEIIIHFIDNYEYGWTKDEVNALLLYFVEPWIEKIPTECLQSPNPVMKLIICFTKNTRYFPLLTVKCPKISALDAVMSLLNCEKVNFKVKRLILEVIEQLLTLEESDSSDLTYIAEIPLKKNQKYGKALLQPYVGVILKYLQNQLTKKYVKVEGMYSLILKSVSEFALDEESSNNLLTLLMPLLRCKATADEDIVLPLLETISNLFKMFKNYDRFESYLLQIAFIFNLSSSLSVRHKLCDLIRYFSEKTGTKFVIADVVQGLNMMDRKWLDQPDYAGRLETFKKINNYAENGELNLYTGIFILYNCFYIIRTEKDFALRDHSGLCLKRICPILCQKYFKNSKELEILLDTVLLPLIKNGIQKNNENYLQESVLLLGHLVRECENIHYVFKDLHPLSEKSNLEVDFFENILHLQNKRRVQALKRFTEIMSKVTKPPKPFSLTLVHPLISHCLLSPKCSTQHELINCSIEALKIICLLSPWRQYERILKQYILEMRKNVALRKQAIRIVSVILDSFHFDISQAEDVNTAKSKDTNRLEKKFTENCLKMNVDEHITESKRKKENTLPAIKRIQVLCRSDAVRVYRSIKSFLIPTLNRAFIAYEEADQYHKLSKKSTDNEKEEMAVLSIPIAYAAIKLLKQLPRLLLDEYISTVFLKLSTYLKSRLDSIRRAARETMQHIMLEVGPSYFPRLLSEMMSVLTKGFQLHVLVKTCHAVLEKMTPLLGQGDIDDCIDSVMEICIVDLFGTVAEEKEVEKIKRKNPETKGNHGYNMLQILAKYGSENHILDLVLPFKEILATHMASKIVKKVENCLHYIAAGLKENKFITLESLLTVSHGVSHERIPALISEKRNTEIEIELNTRVQKPDSYLIPEEPRRMVAEKREICARTNAHVIITFGLKLLSLMLKRDTLKASAYTPYLDPFVPLIIKCLESQYTELIESSLKCLTKLLYRGLPSLEDNKPKVVDSVFHLLGKHSINGCTKENEKLLVTAMQLAQVLLHPKFDVKISNIQIRILLIIVEDLQKSRSHYATAFSLLNSILERGFNLPELHELMHTTAQLSITSYYEDVRLSARKAFYKYLMNYPLGKKLRQHVLYYTAQIEYEIVDGRKSALEMLRVLIQKVSSMQKKSSPEGIEIKKMLLEVSSLLYVKLSSRLILDDVAECKKMVAECISDIVSFVEGTKEEEELFDITLIWIKEKKVCSRRLAVQLFGILLSVKKEKFSSKLKVVLPVMEDQLHDNPGNMPGKYIRAPIVNEPEDERLEKDRLVFQVLDFYKTLLEAFPEFLKSKTYSDNVRQIGESCHILLRHSHEWVRVEASQVLAIIFKSMDANKISAIINKKLGHEKGFLLEKDGRIQIKNLCCDLCDQLTPGFEVKEQLLMATAVNLRFLAEVLQNVKRTAVDKLSLSWLVRKVAKQTRLEVSRAPLQYSVRTIVFTWFAALSMKLDRAKLSRILPIVLSPLLRELSTTDNQGVEIRRKAKEVLRFYRKNTDQNMYDQAVTKVQRLLDVKRARRKMQMARMAVTNPQRAAQQKIKIQLKKKIQKRRRLEKLRKRKFKSGKRKSVELKDD